MTASATHLPAAVGPAVEERRWLPEDPTAWQRGIVWQIQVQPTEGEPWVQEFGLHTPSEAVAGFLTALIATPGR
ncbi:DUF317 domain-containing protein [Streptomyces sp. NBC_00696]|uniref:DUF317 domain-containing protein n=1 Tax=Streptomyces sp. NBC_00696 TaxID=2903672 RepID=UPI002E32B6D7|nr:DUF317 domain-containing protein [Streptomyces sp. NBC_00696]